MSSEDSSPSPEGYEHVQTGIIHHLLDLIAAGLLIPIVFGFFDPPFQVSIILVTVAGLMIFCSACFRYLKISDGGDHLSVRFGPLKIFGTRIEYAKITEIEVGRSSLIDGWGIHYIFGRGWTYNIHGFRCVRLKLGKKIVRLGTDEPELLASFLRNKLDSLKEESPVEA